MPEYEIGLRITGDYRKEFPDLRVAELPEILKKEYGGDFEFLPVPGDRPLVYINFVMSQGGVFNLKDNPGGGPISQGNQADAFGMALLRSSADAVMVGSGTLNGEPSHVWDTDFIFDNFPQMKGREDLREAFASWRKSLGRKHDTPPTYFMTNSGKIDFTAQAFQGEAGAGPFIVTGRRGASQIQQDMPDFRDFVIASDEVGNLDEKSMLETIRREHGVQMLLHEGGRGVVDALANKGLVDEFFLTIINKKPVGDIGERNAQKLFQTTNGGYPTSAKVITNRLDATGEAEMLNLDYRGVRGL